MKARRRGRGLRELKEKRRTNVFLEGGEKEKRRTGRWMEWKTGRGDWTSLGTADGDVCGRARRGKRPRLGTWKLAVERTGQPNRHYKGALVHLGR